MYVQSIAAAGVEAFSIDVFDTFLLRRCSGREGVFERAFALVPFPAGAHGDATQFVDARRAAEKAARRAALAEHGGSEIGIDEIYRHFPCEQFGLPADAAPVLAAAEFQAERELCFANPVMVAELAALRAAGIRAGFIADTCWNERQLTELLRVAAPTAQWDFLFSSCDHRRRKAEGLFAHALGQLRVAPAAAAHLGDNGLADVVAARALGMRAMFQHPVPAELEAMFQQEDALLSSSLDDGARALRRTVATLNTGSDSPAFAFGLYVLGPVLAAFDRFIARALTPLMVEGKRVAVAFDPSLGPLPLEIWRMFHPIPAFTESETIALDGLDAVATVSLTGDMPEIGGHLPNVPLALVADAGNSAHGFLSLPPSVGAALPLLEALGRGSEVAAQISQGIHRFVRGMTELVGFPDVCAAPTAPSWAATILTRALDHPSENERTLVRTLTAMTGEVACTNADIRLIGPEEELVVRVNCLRDDNGDMHIRVPLSRDSGVTAVAIPASVLPARGRMRSVTLQTGDSAVEAMRNGRCDRVPLSAVHAVDAGLAYGRYQGGADGCLLIRLPVLDRPAALLTLIMAPWS